MSVIWLCVIHFQYLLLTLHNYVLIASDFLLIRLFQLYNGPNRPLRQVDKWNAWFFEDLKALVSIVISFGSCIWLLIATNYFCGQDTIELECGPMPNVMAALPTTGGTLR